MANFCDKCGKTVESGVGFCDKCGRAQQQATRVICTNCNSPVHGAGITCKECGASLPRQIFCQKCGAQQDGTEKFCGQCGESVEELHSSSAEVHSQRGYYDDGYYYGGSYYGGYYGGGGCFSCYNVFFCLYFSRAFVWLGLFMWQMLKIPFILLTECSDN